MWGRHPAGSLWYRVATKGSIWLRFRLQDLGVNVEWVPGGSEAGSHLRLMDSRITQLKAQGPSWTCNESKEVEDGGQRYSRTVSGCLHGSPVTC